MTAVVLRSRYWDNASWPWQLRVKTLLSTHTSVTEESLFRVQALLIDSLVFFSTCASVESKQQNWLELQSSDFDKRLPWHWNCITVRSRRIPFNMLASVLGLQNWAVVVVVVISSKDRETKSLDPWKKQQNWSDEQLIDTPIDLDS